ACLVFFFQAEDGIRDFHVTGLQTCALPILRLTFDRRLQVDEAEALRPVLGEVLARGSESARDHQGDHRGGQQRRPAPTLTAWHRSEERRVGKERRSRRAPYRYSERA